MSRELLASQKNNSGILLDPRTKLAVLITIAVFILGGSYEGIMQYYIIVLAAIPLLLLSAARKWKGAVLYILIFGGSLCLERFGLSRLPRRAHRCELRPHADGFSDLWRSHRP